MRITAALLFAVALHAAGPRLPLGLDLYRPYPEDNPITPAKIALGRRLFHERQLSRDGCFPAQAVTTAGGHSPTGARSRWVSAAPAATATCRQFSIAHGATVSSGDAGSGAGDYPVQQLPA